MERQTNPDRRAQSARDGHDDNRKGNGRIGTQSGKPAARNRQEASPGVQSGGLSNDSDLAHAASVAARETYRAVTAEASELAANIGEEVTHAAEHQKERGADIMIGFARAITTAADEIQGQSPIVARQFKSAADGVGRLSDDLRDRSIHELVGIASGYARRQPAVFFAGAVAAGFALTRFLKSSPEAASSSQSTQADSAGPRHASAAGAQGRT
jgi:hypothetical protein